ncbi:MAG: hypothetical protein ABIT16_02450 [Croceibacterium sp.]
MNDRQPPFDYVAYLDALPRHVLGPPRPNAPTRYPVTRYPLLKAYNGFSGIERRRGGHLAGWLLAAGCMTVEEHCDICGKRGRHALHGDVYYDVSRDPTLCRPCHRAIHMRFYRWSEWQTLVDASAVTGSEWFVMVPRHAIDIAQHLRDRWGWQAANLEQSPICPFPDVIAEALPGNMLPHPAL